MWLQYSFCAHRTVDAGCCEITATGLAALLAIGSVQPGPRVKRVCPQWQHPRALDARLCTQTEMWNEVMWHVHP